MSAIAAWLQGLGLEKYIGAFEEAEIDAGTVALLSDGDLRELGLPLGPRRLVLDACARMAGSAPPPAPAEPEAAHTAPERRQLTVMFADLVNSTAMSVTTDPEELNDLLTRYRHAVVGEVERHGGTIAKYMGDGVLAYFGWPIAHEDADEDSVRAALAIVRAVNMIGGPDGQPLQSRVGIATGLVVVGGVVGTGTAREDQVAGEALNLAARLQSVAQPDMVVVADSTYRLAGQRYAWRSLGSVEVKGFDAPVAAWQPIAEQVHASRFAAARTVRSALIGRDGELGLLRERWREAGDGAGATVLVVGEPGLGKSRLVEAFEGGLAVGAAARVRLQCSAFHQNNALYPVIEYLTAAAGIEDVDEPAVRLAKLTAALGPQSEEGEGRLALIADLLSIPAGAGYVVPAMVPGQRRAATIAALARWLAQQAEPQPLLLVVEDVHWADATTLELMNRLVGAAGTTAMLVVITSRPEFASPWSGRPRVDVLGLDRLPDGACEQLVAALVETRSVQPETIQQIIAKSDGNPLFLEELSLAVLDARAHHERQLVPDTLQGSLMARLDGLGDAKQTAQTASVLGRRFARPLLLRVSALDPHRLDADLSLLVANGIIYPLGRVADGRYEFKHALVRDAAYGSLLLSRRRELHGQCAALLERDFPDVVQTEPELLALHFGEAGQAGAASRYHEVTGDRATARHAYAEALASYGEAIVQAERAGAGQEREGRILLLLLKQGPALCVIRGPQASEVQLVYDRARAIARALDEFDSLFKATWGLWFNANVGRRFDRAAALADELVALSASGDDGHVLEGLHCRWSSALFRGTYPAAITDGTRGESLYDRGRHHHLGVGFGGHDPGVCAYNVRGVSLVLAGRAEEALADVASALELADQLDHPASTAHALQGVLTVFGVLRDAAATLAHAERLHALACRLNFHPLRLLANHMIGWAEVQTGDTERGMARMAADLEQMIAISPMPVQYASLYADALAKDGRTGEALGLLDTLMDRAGQPDEGHFLSEVHRVRGDCLAATGRRAEAEEAYAKALGLAAAQGATWFALRTGMSRVRGGCGGDAREALAATLASLPTTGDWPDVIEARALIAG